MTALEAIRLAPGMYIGDTHDGSGLTNMVWEVLANALDEHLAGHCERISVEIHADGSISVEDDGRGISITEVDGVSFTERAFTSLHDSPTLDGHAPHEHVGLHGVGVFVVCALSERLEVHSHREGSHFAQRFARGVAVSRMQRLEPARATGTRVTFAPDPAIFTDTWFDPGRIAVRLREMSYLLPRLTLEFRDLRRHVFHESRGLVAQVELGARDRRLATFSASDAVEDVLVEVAARWEGSSWPRIESFANVQRTTDGGTHVRGLLHGLADGLKQVAPAVCAQREPTVIERSIGHGLIATVCVRLDDPTYGLPTRTRLMTPKVGGAVRSLVGKAFADFLRREPSVVEHIASQFELEGSAAAL